MGQSATVYMPMGATVWAMKGAAKGVQVGGFEPLANYIEQFLELGGQIPVCAPCSEYYCSFDAAQASGSLLEEASRAGLATVVGLTGADEGVVTF